MASLFKKKVAVVGRVHGQPFQEEGGCDKIGLMASLSKRKVAVIWLEFSYNFFSLSLGCIRGIIVFYVILTSSDLQNSPWDYVKED